MHRTLRHQLPRLLLLDLGCSFVSLVVVCYLDRTSLAFAALQLCQEPWFDARVYGLVSSPALRGTGTADLPRRTMHKRV